MSEVQNDVLNDERAVAVGAESYARAFAFLMLAMLLDGAYRAIVRHEAAWDMLLLPYVALAVARLYQWKKRAVTRYPSGARKQAIIAGIIFGILGALLGWFLGQR